MPQLGIARYYTSGAYLGIAECTLLGYISPMKLQDYLKSEGLTVRQFADQIGETESAVRKWVYGQRQPSLPAAVAVERATKGAVTSSDLLLSDTSTVAA